jgi:hypothetical protein
MLLIGAATHRHQRKKLSFSFDKKLFLFIFFVSDTFGCCYLWVLVPKGLPTGTAVSAVDIVCTITYCA